VFIFILFSYVVSQAQSSCQINSDCNNILTNNTQYCSVSSGVGTCTALSAFSSLGVLPANSYCSAGIYQPLLNSCVQYGNVGCAPGLTTSCSGNSTLQLIPLQCIANPPTLGLGQACGGTTAGNCDVHLYCDQKVCRPTIANGFACSTGFGAIPCSIFSVCDNGYCTPRNSQSNGSPCSQAATCQSGNCVSARCVTTGNVACYSNTDCIASFPGQIKYCSSTDNRFNTQGFCISDTSNSYYSKLSACIANNCYNNYATNAMDCVYANCMSQLVASQCATYCPNRPDQRYTTTLGDGIYDCQKLVRTIAAPNTCNTIQQFQNCFIAGNAYSTSFNILLFLTTLILFI